MNLQQLKLQYIEAVYKTKALLIKTTPFTLKSGNESFIYLNHRNFLSQHRYLSLVATIYGQLAHGTNTDFQLGIVDSIMSPIIVGAMSHLLNKDFVVVRKTHLSHGTKDIIYGDIKKDIILIDDMTSTGGTIIEAADTLRQTGATVKHAIVSAVRDDTAEKNLKAKQIKLWSIATFDEIMNGLQTHFCTEENQIIQLERRIQT